jgi:hypothetical protein
MEITQIKKKLKALQLNISSIVTMKRTTTMISKNETKPIYTLDYPKMDITQKKKNKGTSVKYFFDRDYEKEGDS